MTAAIATSHDFLEMLKTGCSAKTRLPLHMPSSSHSGQFNDVKHHIIAGSVSSPQMAVRPSPLKKPASVLKSTLPQQRSPLQPSSSSNTTSSNQHAQAAAHSNANGMSTSYDGGPKLEASSGSNSAGAVGSGGGNNAGAVGSSSGLAVSSSNGSGGGWEGSVAMPVSKSANSARVRRWNQSPPSQLHCCICYAVCMYSSNTLCAAFWQLKPGGH